MAKSASTTDQAQTPTGPADTNDPNVRVSSVRPRHTAAVDAGQPTAPATVQRPGGRPPSPQVGTPQRSTGRTETYELERPGGAKVKVTRDLDTGEATYDDEA